MEYSKTKNKNINKQQQILLKNILNEKHKN